MKQSFTVRDLADGKCTNIAKDKLSIKEYEDPFGEGKENRKPNPNRKTTAKS